MNIQHVGMQHYSLVQYFFGINHLVSYIFIYPDILYPTKTKESVSNIFSLSFFDKVKIH